MGGGNGQKSKMARERNNEKMKAPKVDENLLLYPSEGCIVEWSDYGLAENPLQCENHCQTSVGMEGLVTMPLTRTGSQLESNKKAMNIQCKVCMQTFMCTTSEVKCREHAEAKHPKSDLYTCFPHLKK